MKVRLHRGQLSYFRRRARESGPNEIFAYLIGRNISPKTVIVQHFFYPALDESTPECVVPNKDDEDNIAIDVVKKGQKVLGTIHSHPDYWPILSRTDHQSHVTDQHRISGVYAWLKGKSKVVFWTAESSLPCQIEYI